jgi:nicotinamidase-related amidase
MVSHTKHAKAAAQRSPSNTPKHTPASPPKGNGNGGACPLQRGITDPITASIDRIVALREAASRRGAEEKASRRPVDRSRLLALQAIAGHRAKSPTNPRHSSHRERVSGGVSSDATTQSLRQMLGLPSSAPNLADDCALVLIDCQNTYTHGPMHLHGVETALRECRRLLDAARRAGTTIVHIVHDAGVGSLYDVAGHSGAIVDVVAPQPNESVIVKHVPSSFHQTELEELLKRRGVKNVVLCGFMTHCCVSSTARVAFNLGYANVTVVASATATRTLNGPTGEVPAVEMQRSTLAGIAELHAHVARTADDVIHA